jgi:hypothetical protein
MEMHGEEGIIVLEATLRVLAVSFVSLEPGNNLEIGNGGK